MPVRTREWGSSRRVITVEGSSLQRVIATQAHEPGKVYTHLQQPEHERKLILERNKRLQNDPGSMRDASFGRMVASIPLDDYQDLLRKYPELNDRSDARARSARLIRILQTDPDCKKYLLGARV